MAEQEKHPQDARPKPPDNEWPCGCRTEDGVFMPCADHVSPGPEVG